MAEALKLSFKQRERRHGGLPGRRWRLYARARRCLSLFQKTFIRSVIT
jgi:hypothetical protein